MSEKTFKLKLNKTHYLFFGIGIMCVLMILAIIDYWYLDARFLALPKVIKTFLRKIAPFFAVTLSFFLWDKGVKRPNKLFIALFITFFLDVFVFEYLTLVIGNWMYNWTTASGLNFPQDLPIGMMIFSTVYGILGKVNDVLQLVFAWMILKRIFEASKAVKAVFICFIVYMLAYFLTYYVFMHLRYFFAPDSVDTVENYYIMEKWDIVYRIIHFPYALSRFAVVLTSFPLMVHFMGEDSLWVKFKHGPLRIFKKIMSDYNPNGVK